MLPRRDPQPQTSPKGSNYFDNGFDLRIKEIPTPGHRTFVLQARALCPREPFGGMLRRGEDAGADGTLPLAVPGSGAAGHKKGATEACIGEPEEVDPHG